MPRRAWVGAARGGGRGGNPDGGGGARGLRGWGGGLPVAAPQPQPACEPLAPDDFPPHEQPALPQPQDAQLAPRSAVTPRGGGTR